MMASRLLSSDQFEEQAIVEVFPDAREVMIDRNTKLTKIIGWTYAGQ